MHAIFPSLNELYFGVLRRGLHPSSLHPPIDSIGGQMWQALYRLAVRQGTSAIVLAGIETLPTTQRPPREVRIQWAVQAERIGKRYRRQREAARRAAGLLAEKGIRMLVLKGIGLSAHYPVPEYRECGDIDIYLFGAHDAGNRILCEAGAKVVDEVPKHTGLVWQGVHFENHRNFLNISRNPQERELDALLCDRLQREGPASGPDGWFTPSATFNAVYLVRHAALHFLKEGISARHLCDWCCFLERQGDAVDRKLFTATLRRYGMERFERLLTAAAIECCGLHETMPDHDSGELKRFIAEVIAYAPPPAGENRFARLLRKFRTPYAHRWRFRLLGLPRAAYYWEVVRAQRRERFTLLR